MKEFYSNGKLLLSGEYVVLDGATALAIPTSFGQSLRVEKITEPVLNWKSIDFKGNTWFEGDFRFEKGQIKATSNSGKNPEPISDKLQNILTEAHKLNPEILSESRGYKISSRLDFPQNWGLGSSSTLINNISQWFDIDPYQLLEKTFGGSGYDIASAQNEHAITYTLNNNKRQVLAAGFDPAFKNELFFVHLNRKQSSRESIAHYRNQPKEKLEEAVEKITSLTHQIIASENLPEFELFLEIHETVISQIIQTPKIKRQLFQDYPRAIKSLGGWGGDFILATGGEKEKEYFRSKGYETIVSYPEMVL
ncbi:hypothetical protein GCM10007103_24960 [Salinimicrobium marinum]|uniref:Mevalonate kinase n=1 Tax=Salinimicrobium marinum TaxID=680283 RepID=A0A918SHB3_9FLAO|nr:GYDIA family GHMP kinase [Salinimicrobium marinum]GHA42823.1 hypothetical protein GCM10007103_24960 [Salinimicrobium marinum]